MDKVYNDYLKGVITFERAENRIVNLYEKSIDAPDYND